MRSVLLLLLFKKIYNLFPEKDATNEAVKICIRKKEIQEEIWKMKEEQAKKGKIKVKQKNQLNISPLKLFYEL